MLAALGAPVEELADVPAALRARREERWRRPIEPVMVAWDGRIREVGMRVPSAAIGGGLSAWIELDSGERIGPSGSFGFDPFSRASIEGRRFVEGTLIWDAPASIPDGYHRLVVDMNGTESSSLLISAPFRATGSPEERRWGVFMPLHALRTRHTLGIGDFTDLETLTEWVRALGGSMVATLPLLAGFFEDPFFETSPYSPASRLFWNELFIDLEAVPELDRSAEARGLLASAGYRRELAALGSKELVDYRATMAAKRRVLQMLADAFWTNQGPRREAFDAFANTTPRLLDYASFRAACERHGRSWDRWPARERDGRLPPDGGLPDAARYHAYVQWLAEEQLSSTAGRARSRGAALYFDMPLGVNPAGYDGWREPDAFLSGVSAGAPPDAFFKGGQDWGFRPLSPEGIRAQGYRYPIEVLRHVLRHAGVLRIDHALGMHRLYVIPAGMNTTDGAYIRYRPEEWYAILCLESRRSGTVLVGEDLGTVPLSVTQALLRHGIQRSYVMQFELARKRGGGIRPPPRGAASSFNTHDMAPFASFWRARDVDQWVKLGLADPSEADVRKGERDEQRKRLIELLVSEGFLRDRDIGDDSAVLSAALRYLAASRANLVVVALEDLWRETRPQNVPGTTAEHPNWRRRARFGFESFRRLPEVTSTLALIDEARKEGGGELGETPPDRASGRPGADQRKKRGERT